MKHEGIEKLAEIIHEFFLEPENKKAFEEWKKLAVLHKGGDLHDKTVQTSS